MFTRAIVRRPGPNFARGLTSSELGAPDYLLALRQHEAYCLTLEQCGLELLRLETETLFPDSTFVEDTAIIAPSCVIITNPGAVSRQGEVKSVKDFLSRIFSKLDVIEPPGTVDGGDICEAGNHFFIGISHRTNYEGAEQIAHILQKHGHTTSTIDVRSTPGILHLKSGISYLGQNRLAVISTLLQHPAFTEFERYCLPESEEYAANCVLANNYLLVPAGFPAFTSTLNELGYNTIKLEMSEFQKMDGGLSCLSLRF